MYNEKERKRAIELYKSGATLADCASEIGCSIASVWNWLTVYACTRPAGRRAYSEQERIKALAMVDRGMSFRQVEYLTGIPNSTVHRWKKKSRS